MNLTHERVVKTYKYILAGLSITGTSATLIFMSGLHKIIIKSNTQNDNMEILNYKEMKDECFSGIVSQPTLYKKIFDECYKQERFEMYEYWYRVGMAIRNTFQDDEIQSWGIWATGQIRF